MNHCSGKRPNGGVPIVTFYLSLNQFRDAQFGGIFGKWKSPR